MTRWNGHGGMYTPWSSCGTSRTWILEYVLRRVESPWWLSTLAGKANQYSLCGQVRSGAEEGAGAGREAAEGGAGKPGGVQRLEGQAEAAACQVSCSPTKYDVPFSRLWGCAKTPWSHRAATAWRACACMTATAAHNSVLGAYRAGLALYPSPPPPHRHLVLRFEVSFRFEVSCV